MEAYRNQTIIDYVTSKLNGQKIKEWGQWEKHFAFFPKRIKGETVWMKTYYSKTHIFMDFEEYGTILDVLKDGE